uniref:Sulfotransferase domain-containing protein n=1 Tax=Pinguiococcus pyrenoidosus TaxID=172671 RepID=A0A7R9UCG8_9STRA|mmetsp:Transcript_3734/g.14638  ORF Transcript_3734/g.14638 Transcript_3734/m.14638 type:complete len:408 (+) Transcript_3734:136-1359(+)
MVFFFDVLFALGFLSLVGGIAAVDEAALAFCRTTDVEKLTWDPKNPIEGLRLMEAALEANCGTKEYSSPHAHVFYIKTHKTGSSTLMRLFALKGMSMNVAFGKSTMNSDKRFWRDAICPHKLRDVVVANDVCIDMSVRHVFNHQRWWGAEDCSDFEGHWLLEVYGIWKEFFATDVAVIIPTREPMSHLVSALAFYEIDRMVYVQDSKWWNPLSQDLRLFSHEDIDNVREVFMQVSEHKGYDAPEGLHVVELEKIYESLVLLRHRLRWNLRDMVTISVVHFKDQARARSSADLRGASRDTFDFREDETLALDRHLYGFFSSFMQDGWGHLGRSLGTSVLQDEVASLACITENVNMLAAPLFASFHSRSAYFPAPREDLPLLSALCVNATERGLDRQMEMYEGPTHCAA